MGAPAYWKTRTHRHNTTITYCPLGGKIKHGYTSLLKNQNPPAQHHNYILSSWGENKACPGGIVSHNEAKKVHRSRKETLGATHNYLKCLQRIEYNYVSQASWKHTYFLKQSEHNSSYYKNFLNGLPASSSCMCCNIESFTCKKKVELHLISSVIINDVNM